MLILETVTCDYLIHLGRPPCYCGIIDLFNSSIDRPSQGLNTGSNPVGTTTTFLSPEA